MKKLLSLLFIILSVTCKGQTPEIVDIKLGGILSFDTVRVLMLCSDTAKPKPNDWTFIYLKDTVFWTFAVKGYEVRRVEFHEGHKDIWWAEGDQQMPPNDPYNDYYHFKYLDENQKPLKYFVWQSQQLK